MPQSGCLAARRARINHSDLTPDVTYTYDRRGRQTTMAAGGVTTTRKFNDAGNLLSEAYSGGPLNGLTVTNRYDAWLRRATNGVWNGSTWLAQTRYGYDEASRLRTVAAGTNTVAYSYLADSPLVGEIGFTNGSTVRMTTSKSYDYLNRLTAVDSRIGVAPVSISTYGYNPANQRTSVTNLDNARWVYQYDALGQVISGKKYWSDGTPVAGQHFEYTFDDIGNRQSTKAGGDNSGANLRPASYLNNPLNQILSREVPSYVNVLGTASNNATVTLWGDNGQYSPTTRKGEYFRGELYANNTTGAVWLTITNVAVLNNGANPDIVTNQTGKVLLSKTPETFAYDADGNLTSDSLWTNVWNGENRRTTIESRSTLPAAARRREQWTHLPDGRRIQRIVSTNNGAAYYPAYTNRYVWDAQVLLAVLDHTNGLVMSFMRGLDLSGSIQGAGGVGGVLAVNFKTNGTHFFCYDGNGNVTALVNAANGSESARYEYGPFGETIRMTGPVGKLNPIRFSTQYADDVTGEVKYLFRDYDPNTGRWPNRDPIGERGGLNVYAFCRNNPVSVVDPHGKIGIVPIVVGGAIIIGGAICIDAIACYSHMNDIRNQATDRANETMRQLDPNYDEDENGPNHEGSTADALRHCIGACMANQHPGACISSRYVRSRIQARENGQGLNHQMDRANNQTGFGITGDCVQGCINALRNGGLQCFGQGDTQTSPCRMPGGAR